MRRVLSANFNRMWHHKLFWLMLAGSFLVGLVTTKNNIQSAAIMAEHGYEVTAEMYLYEMVPVLGAILGVFASLFLGIEHSNGTIRNKIIAGLTRSKLYYANYTSCFAASFLLLLSWFLGAVVLLPWSRLPLEHGYAGIVKTFILLGGTQAAFSAIYVLIATLNTNIAITVVMSFATFFAMQMMSGVAYINGAYERMGNPSGYVGLFGGFYKTILELLPTGQTELISRAEVINPLRQFLFSCGVTAFLLMIGVLIFQKKGLK